MITGIVVALPEELSTLTATKIAKGCCIFIKDNVLVAYSGAGFENAARAAELLQSQGASRLISWGCAAALSPQLKSGDLTLATTFLDSDRIQLEVDSTWQVATQKQLEKILPIHSGALLESKSIVSLGLEKQKLHTATGAIVLDMESIGVAKVAQQYNLPFLAIRAIADPVTMDLPKAVAHALNEQGEVVLNRLLLFLFQHPTELPGLIKLGLHFNAAKKTLKQVATQLDAIINFELNNKIF